MRVLFSFFCLFPFCCSETEVGEEGGEGVDEESSGSKARRVKGRFEEGGEGGGEGLGEDSEEGDGFFGGYFVARRHSG